MEQVKAFLIGTVAKRFYWNTLAGFLAVVVIVVADTNWVYAPIIAAVLNGAMKEINSKYGNPK